MMSNEASLLCLFQYCPLTPFGFPSANGTVAGSRPCLPRPSCDRQRTSSVSAKVGERGVSKVPPECSRRFLFVPPHLFRLFFYVQLPCWLKFWLPVLRRHSLLLLFPASWSWTRDNKRACVKSVVGHRPLTGTLAVNIASRPSAGDLTCPRVLI